MKITKSNINDILFFNIGKSKDYSVDSLLLGLGANIMHNHNKPDPNLPDEFKVYLNKYDYIGMKKQIANMLNYVTNDELKIISDKYQILLLENNINNNKNIDLTKLFKKTPRYNFAKNIQNKDYFIILDTIHNKRVTDIDTIIANMSYMKIQPVNYEKIYKDSLE